MPKTTEVKHLLPNPPAHEGRVRAVIDAVLPCVDSGRFPGG